MKESGLPINEGLVVGVIARCAESNPKYLEFAEEVAGFAQSRGQKTLLVYSALMKVYAHAGFYDKACDLYGQLTADGLEPDSVMYGCLMKFAAECGRTDLSRQLSEKAPSLDIQNYMSLIRAAGRDKDVQQAFATLDRLNASGVKLDVAAYNCVLDVCASCGEMTRARALTKEMQKQGLVDVITFNTLLKGYCHKGDITAAKSILAEMKSLNIEPNDISHNLYLNAAIRIDFGEAWRILESIEANGMVDHYTISILMKELKKIKVRNPDNLRRAFGILERSGLDVCSDEILLTTVIEACMWFRDVSKLEKLLGAYRASKLRPSISVYGAMIKAASMMRRVDMCREFWCEAVEERSLKPSDITLGCMLDALVSNNCVNDAVALFASWKEVVRPNTVMYSTLAKGFANTRQPARAMDLWRDMRSQKIKMNTVTCNAIIDAQARSGLMDDVSEIVAVMEREGCPPDVITFSTVIKGYCVKGDLDRAFEVFRSTQKSGFVTDSVIYNTLLDGCLRHNRMELADKLVEEMEERNIVPSNFTLGILVRMYGRRHQVDRAFEVTETLSKRHGIRVNTEVKTCLIAACINNHEIDRALQIFADLRQAKADLDSKIYGTLISGCIRFNKLSEAVGLVEDAYGLKEGNSGRGLRKGESLEKDFVEHVLHSLKKKGMMNNLGSPLLAKLRVAKEPVAAQIILNLGNDGKRNEGRRKVGAN
jgi:pentatricopeptide repeat protein